MNELKLLAKQDKEKFFSLMDSVTNTGLSKRPTTSSFKKIQKNDLKKQHSLQSPSQTPSKSLASVEKAKPCQEDLVHNDVDDDDDDVNYDTGTYRSTYGKKLKGFLGSFFAVLYNIERFSSKIHLVDSIFGLAYLYFLELPSLISTKS